MNKFSVLFMSVVIAVGLAGCSEMDLQDLEITVDEEEVEKGKSMEERVEELEKKLSEEEVVKAEGNEMNTEKTSLSKEEEGYIDVAVSVSSVTQEFSRVLHGVTKEQNSLEELGLNYAKVDLALTMLNDMVKDNVVPELFENMHRYLIGMCEYIMLSQTHLIEGIRDNDDVKIDKGADYLEESGNYTTKVEEEYRLIIEKYKRD